MSDLRERRIAQVRAHMQLENEGRFDEVLKTFAHPRYEFQVPRGADAGPHVFDGPDEVMAYFRLSRTPFPDLGNEVIAIVADEGDLVMTEFFLIGTHLGPLKTPWGIVPPTGRKFKLRMAATFEFAPGSDKIISERPYSDPEAIRRLLGLVPPAV